MEAQAAHLSCLVQLCFEALSISHPLLELAAREANSIPAMPDQEGLLVCQQLPQSPTDALCCLKGGKGPLTKL